MNGDDNKTSVKILSLKRNIDSILSFIGEIKDISLPQDETNLLILFIECSKMIDSFIETYEELKANTISFDVLEERYQSKIMDNIKVISKVLFKILWCWHDSIRGYNCPSKDEVHRDIYIISWANISRILYIILTFKKEGSVKKGKYIFDKSASDFQFVDIISKKYNKIVVSNEKISKYDIKILIQSFFLLWPCLYKFPYSLCMIDYFNSLIMKIFYYITFKNCDYNTRSIFSRYEKIGDNRYYGSVVGLNDDYREDRDNDEDYNNIKLYSDENKYSLKSSFIFDSEILIYHQLKRFSICNLLLFDDIDTQVYKKNLITWEYFLKKNDYTNRYKYLLVLLGFFINFNLGIVTNQFYKNTILDDFKSNLSSLYVFHGESERYLRENKNSASNDHSDDIINSLRPHQYILICNIKDHAPFQILGFYHEIMKKNIEELSTKYKLQTKSNGDSEIFNEKNEICFTHINTYEREIIYISYLSLSKHFQSSYKNIDIKNIFLSELFAPHDAIIEKINTPFKKGYLPCLINIMNLTFILYYDDKKNDTSFFFSYYFIESFVLWLSLLYKQGNINFDSENRYKTFFDNKIFPIFNL